MKLLKIVNLVTQMEAGGAQGAATRVAEELRRRGHIAETWFLYLKRPTYTNQEGIRVLRKDPPGNFIDYLRIFTNLIRKLHAFGPDGVITYTHYANIMGQVAAFLVGVPGRVASQRNPSWTYPRFARYLDVLTGSTGFYKRNIAVSRAVFDSFATYPSKYRDRLRIVYNGIHLPEFSVDKVTARRRFGLPLEVPLIVNVGRLAEQKNQHILLRVLKRLPDITLAIAGDGELRSSLENEAKRLGVLDRAFFLGEIAPQEVPDFLRAGDIFVFPSIFEAFGFAMVEAMAVGIPVIASDIPALREVLEREDGIPAGILIDPEDELGLCESIQRILENRNFAASVSEQAKDRVQMFSLENMVDGYESCLQESLIEV